MSQNIELYITCNANTDSFCHVLNFLSQTGTIQHLKHLPNSTFRYYAKINIHNNPIGTHMHQQLSIYKSIETQCDPINNIWIKISIWNPLLENIQNYRKELRKIRVLHKKMMHKLMRTFKINYKKLQREKNKLSKSHTLESTFMSYLDGKPYNNETKDDTLLRHTWETACLTAKYNLLTDQHKANIASTKLNHKLNINNIRIQYGLTPRY